MDPIENYISERLDYRKKQGLYRSLAVENNLIDFASNDYLGFAYSNKAMKWEEMAICNFNSTGSTGSRLITGNTKYAEELEQFISEFHKAEAGLIFNSGYDANLGLLSSLPQKGDTVIYDAYIHASIRDGIRLSNAFHFSFKHNDIKEFTSKIKRAKGRIFVAVESVYSMDGDFAPLIEMVNICEQYNAYLIVDEAHATGVFGENGSGKVVELGLEKKIFARIHTFGKALGCHGAIVVGSKNLRDYLINFSRPFIYTTALPLSSLINIKTAYAKLIDSEKDLLRIKKATEYFRRNIKLKHPFELIQSTSPIQCILIPGNEKAKSFAEEARKNGFDIRAILSPTVPKGKERIRICIHAFNTDEQLTALVNIIHSIMNKKGQFI
ncbi:MAG: 8-amino-7-oxononanoate synthase [Bacteroidetes bacterium]|nr:8-amino-7-oxononanoate synthase [Bacteroidota bacterium]HET6245292.1 8-amino-7-oxononanoate synthase [Bacteroidia bacterium]